MKRLIQWLFEFFKRGTATFTADLKEDTSQEVYRKIKYYMFSISVLWIFSCTYFIGTLLAETMPFMLQAWDKDAILIVRNDEWYASVCLVACAFFQDSHEWFLEKITDRRVVDIYRYGMLISDDFYFPNIARLGKEILIYCGLGLLIHIAFSNVYLYEDRFVAKNPLTFKQEDYLISQIDSVKHISRKIYSNGNTEYRPHIEIFMKGGRIWESYNFDEEKNISAFRLIAQKANVKIDTVLEFKK